MSKPELFFPSKYEIPSSDINLKILLDSLEISVILKLWVSLLTEKHIIILANSNFLLFTVCEALLTLIFPFRWLHTYIPVLSSHELDYLESPTPYIMGVNSSYTDYDYLKSLFPNHVICDISTSQIFSSSLPSLPNLDEVKIRKKVSYLKNPEIYNIDEVHIQSYKKSSSQSRTSHIQMEDVSLTRTYTHNLQYIFFRVFRSYLNDFRSYFRDKVFDSQRFLEDLYDEECKDFWSKIINTVAFEYFILSDQYLDDSNIRLFENILQETDSSLPFVFHVNMSEDLSEMFDRLINFAIFKKKAKPDSIEKWKFLSRNYREYVRQVVSANEDNLKNDHSCSQNVNGNSEDGFTISFYSEDFFEFLNDTIHNEAFEKAEDVAQFYKDKRSKEIETILNLHDYKRSPLKGNQSQPNNSLNITPTNLSPNLLTNLSHSIHLTGYYPTYSYFTNLENQNSFQFFLLAAFNLEDSPHLKDIVFENYFKACMVERTSFPRIRFLQFLNLYDPRQCKDLLKKSCPSLMKKIIEHMARKGTKVRYKSLVLESDDYFKKDASSNEEIENKQENQKKKRGNFLTTDYLPKVRLEDSGESRKTSSFFRKKSSIIADNYDNRTNAGKIIENLKSDEVKSREKLLKMNIINNYTKIYTADKDPISHVEELSIKILTFLTKNSLDKYKPEMLSHKLFSELHSHPQFLEIKNLVAQLQKINLNKLFSEKCKICLWLNLFNFLVIFTLIFKKEVLSNYYEWYRFLKNAYFNIGGFEISLYEIQNGILSTGKFSYNMYGEVSQFPENDPKTALLVNLANMENVGNYLNFAMCLPTVSSTCLRVYFPSTLTSQLKSSVLEYFSKCLIVDLDYNVLSVAELIMWNDSRFKENLSQYEEIVSSDFLHFITETKLSLFIVKYDWTMTFCNVEGSEL